MRIFAAALLAVALLLSASRTASAQLTPTCTPLPTSTPTPSPAPTSTPDPCAECDLDGNGYVDAADILLVETLVTDATSRASLLLRLGDCWEDTTRDTPTPTPTPSTVDLVWDGTGTVTRWASVSGAVVDATGPDGTHYTLELPPGSLLNLTRITLRPMATVSHAPFRNGVAAAVLLEPTPVRLLKPATLTIEGADLPPLTEQLGFRMDQSGNTIHLYPHRYDGARAVFRLNQLGIIGIGRGSHGERHAFARQVTPADAEARACHRMAVPAVRVCDCPGDEGAGDALNAALADWYIHSISPELAAGLTDAASLPVAVAYARAWRAMVEEWDAAGAFATELAEADIVMASAVQRALAEAIARDEAEPNLESITEMLRWYTVAVLLGLEEAYPEMDFDQRFAAIRDRVRFVFNLVSESTSGYNVMPTTADEVVLELSSECPALSGRGDIEYATYSPTGNCGTVDQDGLAVAEAMFELNIGSATPRGFTLALTVDRHLRICDFGASPGRPPNQVPAGSYPFEVYHIDFREGDRYYFDGWIISESTAEGTAMVEPFYTLTEMHLSRQLPPGE